jgi:hypothetical protein
MANNESRSWGATEVLLTVLGALGGVALGAWIFYIAVRMQQHPTQFADPGTSAHIEAQIRQIRGYIRRANQSDNATTGLSNAAAAQALLENAEAIYGDAFARACDPGKLRMLISKVRDRHGGHLMLAASSGAA